MCYNAPMVVIKCVIILFQTADEGCLPNSNINFEQTEHGRAYFLQEIKIKKFIPPLNARLFIMLHLITEAM
jgi:hypothetical protein